MSETGQKTAVNAAADADEQLLRYWEMRRMAIEIGLFAERQLSQSKALSDTNRRFIGRREWLRLTEGY